MSPKRNAASRTSGSKSRGVRAPDAWTLRLYVAGQTPRSQQAMHNLQKICEAHLDGKYRIEVVDLVSNPKLARDDQIVAVPTLVRRLPLPIRKVIGDLSNTERVLVGLQLRASKQGPPL